MPCALCLEDKPLSKSHIIPEFFYTAMYDSKHTYFVLSTDENARRRTKPTGIYERFLCAECEDLTGEWDDYGKKVLFNQLELEHIQVHRKVVLIRGVDYSRFKLFQMSLLWRASVSGREEFAKTTLIATHKEKLRKMLLVKDPGEPFDFGCMLFSQYERSDVRKVMLELVETPTLLSKKLDGHRALRGIFGGLWWLWIVSSHTRYFNALGFLNKEGDLPIIDAGDHGVDYLQRFGRDLKRAGMLD